MSAYEENSSPGCGTKIRFTIPDTPPTCGKRMVGADMDKQNFNTPASTISRMNTTATPSTCYSAMSVATPAMSGSPDTESPASVPWYKKERGLSPYHEGSPKSSGFTEIPPTPAKNSPFLAQKTPARLSLSGLRSPYLATPLNLSGSPEDSEHGSVTFVDSPESTPAGPNLTFSPTRSPFRGPTDYDESPLKAQRLFGNDLSFGTEQGEDDTLDSPTFMETPPLDMLRRHRAGMRMHGPQSIAASGRKNSLLDTKLLFSTRQRQMSMFVFSSHFRFLDCIGKGSFGEVHKVETADGRKYAVKKSRDQFRSRNKREAYLREVENVSQLPFSNNVVKYYRAWQDDQHFFIQMELCEHGNLSRVIYSDERLDEERILSYAVDIALGMVHIHSHKLLHLDIKPENLFIGEQGRLKIGDFGMAVHAKDWDDEEGDCQYIPRELLEGEAGTFTDMFSVGLTLYEMCTRNRLPKQGAEWHSLRDGMLERPNGISDALYTTILRLTLPDWTKRLSAAEFLELDIVKHIAAERRVENSFVETEYNKRDDMSGLFKIPSGRDLKELSYEHSGRQYAPIET